MRTTFTSRFGGKKVIVTGHTGFKGTWLTMWLLELGANVVGIGLDPATKPSHFDSTNLKDKITEYRFDICDADRLSEIVAYEKPDFVFHLAAQAFVGKSYKEPLLTWNTNVIGTINLLNALRNLKNKCSVILITSDKCYENNEWLWGYKETDKLGGKDPYSSSKAGAEIAIHSFYNSYFSQTDSNIRLATTRAGNVIGGGDWSDGRLVPDCVKNWSQGKLVEIRSPYSTRPWQHVLEPLCGYLTLAVELSDNPKLSGESFNFGPLELETHTVKEVVIEMSKHWDAVRWQPSFQQNIKEAGLLKLNCEKAIEQLKWKSILDFCTTIAMTADWYRNYFLDRESINDFSRSQIKHFSELAQKEGLNWVK